MNKNDILLINIPPFSINDIHSDGTGARHTVPPIGLLFLAERLLALPEVGRVKCMDYSLTDYAGITSKKECEEFIKKQLLLFLRKNEIVPTVVGVSVMISSGYSFFKTVVQVVREEIPNAVVVAGGIHATNSASYILRTDGVDYVVCGEGEEVFPRLIKKIVSGGTYAIEGVYEKNDATNATQKLIPATPVQNIDIDYAVYPQVIDMPCYTERTSLFSLSKNTINVPSFSIMASRGCPVSCTFCSAHTVHGKTPRWRSIENITGEMLWLYKNYGVTKFYLLDDNFAPKNKTLELFGAFAQIDIPGIDIVIQNMSVNHTDHDIIDAIAAAGIGYIPFAIETGSVEMQKRIKKRCNLEKAVDLVAYSRKKGLNVRCFYILGFPGETVEQMRQTIEFAKVVGADWSSFNVAVPLPGSEMYQEFVDLGYIKDTPEFWEAATIRDRVFDTPEISASEIKDLAYSANLDVNFVNNIMIREGKFEEAEQIFKNFIVSFDFHLFAYDALRRIYEAMGKKDEAKAVINSTIELIKRNEQAKALLKWKSILPDSSAEIYGI